MSSSFWISRWVAVVLFSAGSLAAAADPFEAVKRADTTRVAATIASDAARLEPLLSDDLSYGDADGRVQTKAQFITAVATSRVKYEAYDYEETKFTEAESGVVVMTGRARLRASAGAERIAYALRFLAVWREEAGKWRLLAYQSSRVPEASAP